MRKPSTSTRRTERGGAAVSVLRKRAAKKAASLVPAKAASGRNGGSGRAAQRKTAPRDARVAERRTSERVLHTSRTAVGASTSRGKYVYCIIEAPDSLRFGPIGIGADPSDVYTVHYKNLAAVVSDAAL